MSSQYFNACGTERLSPRGRSLVCSLQVHHGTDSLWRAVRSLL
jgi:hypothetical protein